MQVEQLLNKYNITPDINHDQHFLIDPDLIRQIVELAELQPTDVVIEVGAGIGNLTRELAQHAGKVIAFEIDQRFRQILTDLPANVELHLENAWDFVQLHGKFWKTKTYNKIVANLPYSFCEPFLHNLTFLKYDKAILLVPQKFANKIEHNPVFSSFFEADIKLKIPPNKFYPVPKTNSVVIDLIHLPDPIENKNLPLFLRQYMYQHEDQKTKNALREGLVHYARLVHVKTLTKNQARYIIDQTGIDKNLLENQPDNPMIYQSVSKKFNAVETTFK